MLKEQKQNKKNKQKHNTDLIMLKYYNAGNKFRDCKLGNAI